jgi:hypothetical protein
MKRYSDADIITAVRDWLASGGSGTLSDWQAEGRLPSSATIRARIGWVETVRAAGGVPKHAQVFLRRDRVSEQACLDAVVAFLADPAEVLGGPAPYDTWAVPRGLPSHQTVQRRFGTWTAAKRAAMRVLEVRPPPGQGSGWRRVQNPTIEVQTAPQTPEGDRSP